MLNIGIIGAGRMGITHQCIVGTHPDVRVVAVADPSKIVTKMLAKYAGVATYTDHAALLAAEQVDAVIVCTPPALNEDILTAAAARGVHAFVEKPFTLSGASGARIAARFAGAGLVGQVGYANRFNDVFTHAHTLLNDGVIGQLIRFRSEMHSGTVIKDQGEGGWRSTHANGGGAVFEMASHAIDLIDYLVGTPDHVSGTALEKVFSRNTEDVVSSSFLYSSGVSGSIFVNWSDPAFRKPTNRIELFGDAGKIQADQHGMKIFLNRALPDRDLGEGWNQLYITDLATPVPFYLRGVEFTQQLYHFIDHVQRRDPATRCTFENGAATLGVIDRIFADAAANQAAVAS